jgi:hypothetical protein
MNILDLVVVKPIKTSDERAEQIGPAQGIPIFGLDGLRCAFFTAGSRKALTPLLTASTPVRAVQPLAAELPAWDVRR